ncbi:MAG: hypothetical protein AAF354_07380 [Pseudomonadota bacterium]
MTARPPAPALDERKLETRCCSFEIFEEFRGKVCLSLDFGLEIKSVLLTTVEALAVSERLKIEAEKIAARDREARDG